MDRVRNVFGFGPRFKAVHMFKDDLDMMVGLVLLHPFKETGGNLFGLWTDNQEPVVHIVLGPAIGCKRTEVSFYQSIPYLERVGGIVTQEYQLCHIGEWHSHHRLSLSEPSAGDSSTVIRNFPRGTCGFLLIIANILPNGKVTLSPYFYREGQTSFDKGEIKALHCQSPFRNVEKISRNILQGQDMSSTANEQRPREGNGRNKEEGGPAVYMFEEDRMMIEGLLCEYRSGKINGEGELLGLWTTHKQPVLHIVLKPTEKAKEKRGEGLSKEYLSLQIIGRYVLYDHPLENANGSTPGQGASISNDFPHGGVLIAAYPKVSGEVGLTAYIYHRGEDTGRQSYDVTFLHGPKVFHEKQKTDDKVEESKTAEGSDLIDFNSSPKPHSPDFTQHLT